MAALTPNPSIQCTHSLDFGREPTKEIMFRSVLQFWFPRLPLPNGGRWIQSSIA